MVLAAGLTIGPLLYAQTAPGIALPAGDATRGKSIFESSKGNCLSCHRVNATGSLYGPDLSAVGAAPRGGGGAGRGGGAAAAARGGATPGPVPLPPAAPAAGARGGQGGGNPGGGPTPQQLAQSILDPNAVVSVQNRYVRLTMKDGRIVWGKLLNVDTFGVQIFEPAEKLTNVLRTDVREMTMISPMPSYRDKLTTQELADVIGYLMSLKTP
jgi:mono/diheme cytochrome c family protein